MDPVQLRLLRPEAEAVLSPEILGEACGCLDDFRGIDLLVLLLTPEFGAFLMWDWEIAS